MLWWWLAQFYRWNKNKSCNFLGKFILIEFFSIWWCFTVQKMKFSMKDFFSKCDQIFSFLRICSHLLKKSLMGNSISVQYSVWIRITMDRIFPSIVESFRRVTIITQNANKRRRTPFKYRKSNKCMQVKVRSHTYSHSHLQWIVDDMRENCLFVEIYLKKILWCGIIDLWRLPKMTKFNNIFCSALVHISGTAPKTFL